MPDAATGTIKAGNGGKPASTSITVTVDSYPDPVPASILDTAERDRVACPHFTATTASGFQVAYTVKPVAAPSLRDGAWCTGQAMRTTGPVTITGAQTTALVRSGHTLITVTMTAVGEPLDEALFQKALQAVAG